MPKKSVQEETLHILCKDRAFLWPLNIMGPVVHPLKVTKKVAVNLLMSGAEIYEYDTVTKMTYKLKLEDLLQKERHKDPEAPFKNDTPVMHQPMVKNTPTAESAVAEENVEEPSEETSLPTLPPIEETLNYLEDGTVDESNIDWSSYSKAQRKALRARINEINAKVLEKN